MSLSYSYTSLAAASVPVYSEYQISEGCWKATSTFYFQTQHGYGANRSTSDGIPTGFTMVGLPNYWVEYNHGNLGYGRCSSPYYTNDMYAVDYPLNRGDYVFSPFSGGTVTFAGRNTSHANYGIFVVIKSPDGKYVSTTGHLDALAYGIRPGVAVNADTVIGYAGNTGDRSIPVGEVHAHQAFYRYPAFKPDGSPYGGRGLQAAYHRYVGTAAGTGPGVYQFVRLGSDTSSTRTKGESISN
ncbi:MAG: M23 family metallopeptidase [Actinomycetota bacterium]|nr:M23 family metallopeptidase [Actinomycetota bacterium]